MLRILRLKSLEWEFWDQSISKTYSEYRDTEFDKHIELNMGDIDHIVGEYGVSRDFIREYLKLFWNNAIMPNQANMNLDDNKKACAAFRNKIFELFIETNM